MTLSQIEMAGYFLLHKEQLGHYFVASTF